MKHKKKLLKYFLLKIETGIYNLYDRVPMDDSPDIIWFINQMKKHEGIDELKRIELINRVPNRKEQLQH